MQRPTCTYTVTVGVKLEGEFLPTSVRNEFVRQVQFEKCEKYLMVSNKKEAKPVFLVPIASECSEARQATALNSLKAVFISGSFSRDRISPKHLRSRINVAATTVMTAGIFITHTLSELAVGLIRRREMTSLPYSLWQCETALRFQSICH